MTVFHEKLRQVIGSSTIEEFANAINESTQRVKDVLRGKQKAPSDFLVNLHVRLGVDLNWLLDDAASTEPKMTLSAREASLIDNYRAAAEAGRRAIEQTSAAVTKQVDSEKVQARRSA